MLRHSVRTLIIHLIVFSLFTAFLALSTGCSRSDLIKQTDSKSSSSAVAARLGIPIYPGAVPYGEQSDIDTHSPQKEGIATTLLKSQDSMQDVIDFYKEKLTVDTDNGTKQQPVDREEDRDGQTVVTLTQNRSAQGTRSVEIRQMDGSTLIELMHFSSSSPVGLVFSHSRTGPSSNPDHVGSLSKVLSQSSSNQIKDQNSKP